MKNTKQVSNAVIKRLPKYYKCIQNLLANGVGKISSKSLSEKMNTTPSQVRQDLNIFGCFGVQGYGYDLELLIREIEKILGLTREYNMVLVGFGNIGKALLKYKSFREKGFKFIKIFDVDEKIIGTIQSGIKVGHTRDIEEYLKNENIDIVVLALPMDAVEGIYDIIIKSDINGIWNYTHKELRSENNIVVEQVQLMDSLLMLSYKINEAKGKKNNG